MARHDSGIDVYEYADAMPAWRWDGPGAANAIHWEPERRVLQVQAGGAGRLVLIEQFYPGWSGSIDGHRVSVESWDGAFQSIMVPAGLHTVAFEYRPRSVVWGAAISMASLMGMVGWLWWSRARTKATT